MLLFALLRTGFPVPRLKIKYVDVQTAVVLMLLRRVYGWCFR
jgi:hypothetical protein